MGFFVGCCLHVYLALVTVGVSDVMDKADGKRGMFFQIDTILEA